MSIGYKPRRDRLGCAADGTSSRCHGTTSRCCAGKRRIWPVSAGPRKRKSPRFTRFRCKSGLPMIKVPLRPSDADVHLDLQPPLDACYLYGGYDDVLNYQADAAPPLTGPDAEWADALLTRAGASTSQAKAKTQTPNLRQDRKLELRSSSCVHFRADLFIISLGILCVSVSLWIISSEPSNLVWPWRSRSAKWPATHERTARWWSTFFATSSAGSSPY